MDSSKKTWAWLGKGLSRRELFRQGGQGGMLALFSGVLHGSTMAAPGPDEAVQAGQKIYQALGVRPIINCRGTFTIIGGSLEGLIPQFLSKSNLIDFESEEFSTIAGRFPITQ